MKRYFLLFLISSFTTLSQTTMTNDTLIWHSSRPLTWTDFKGEVIQGIGLNGEIFCMNTANFEKKSAQHPINYTVNAVFDRTQSWMNPNLRTKQALQYFQITFDIYEVHARKLRHQLFTTPFGADPSEQFQALYTNSMNELKIEYNEFRKATKLGTLGAEVNKWRKKVDVELKELEAVKGAGD